MALIAIDWDRGLVEHRFGKDPALEFLSHVHFTLISPRLFLFIIASAAYLFHFQPFILRKIDVSVCRQHQTQTSFPFFTSSRYISLD